MLISEAIEKYCSYLKYTRHISESTFVNYCDDLKKFISLFKDKTDTSDLYSTDIETFFNNELNNGLSLATALRRLSVIRDFYVFLNREKIVNVPLPTIETPKVIYHLPDILNFEEVEALLAAPRNDKKDEIRDKAMLDLMYSCGLKVNELINIKIADIDFTKKKLIVDKIKKKRELIIPEDCFKQIAIYLKEVRMYSLYSGSKYLFLNKFGNPISRQYFYMMVKEYANRTGINKKISPQTLRHSFATHMIEKGTDIVTLKRILGHEYVTTTEIYKKLANNKTKSAYDLYLKNK